MPLGCHHPPSTCFHLIIIDHLQPHYLLYTHSAVAWGILCLYAHLCASPLPTPPSHSLLTTVNNLFTHGWEPLKTYHSALSVQGLALFQFSVDSCQHFFHSPLAGKLLNIHSFWAQCPTH